MNEYQNNPEDFNKDPGKDKPEHEEKSDKPLNDKKRRTFVELAIGFGISVADYALTWLIFVFIRPTPLAAVINLLIIAAFGFLIVKFFRTKRKAAAILMLVMISPHLLGLLLFGACAISLAPFR